MPIYSKYTGVGGGTTYTFVGVAPITVTDVLGTVTVSMTQADATTDGWLSFGDWNTFNNKQNALTIGNLTSTDITVTGGTGAVIGGGTSLAIVKGNLTGDTNAQISISGGTNCVLGSGTSISQAAASSLSNGYLTSIDWSTFNGKQNALTFGNLTGDVNANISISGGTGAVIGSGASVSQSAANSTTNGYLTSADWSTFNNKQPAGNYITALTGEVTATGPGSATATIANQSGNADKVLSTNGTAVTWQYAGLGSGSFGTNNVILGIPKPAGFVGNNTVLIGSTTTGSALTSANFSVLIGANAGSALTTNSGTFVGTSAGRYQTGQNNCAFGLSALAGSVGAAGNNNHAFGVSALAACTGSNNSGFGQAVLAACTSGGQNVGVGHSVLSEVTTSSNNTAMGYTAARYNSGSNNTALGVNALLGVTATSTGGNNTAVGGSAATALTTATDVVAIGLNSLAAITTSGLSTAVGSSAIRYNTAANNTAVGYQALQGSSGASTGSDNVAIGYQAGLVVTTGTRNVMLGAIAGNSNTTGSDNTMIGRRAGQANSTGTYNVFVGAEAGGGAGGGAPGITTGSDNVIIGGRASYYVVGTTSSLVSIGRQAAYNISGTGSVAIGANSLFNFSNSPNVSVGYQSMQGSSGASTGTNNTAIGHQTGLALTSGSSNIFLGHTAGDAVTTGSSNTIIGDIAGTTTLASTVIMAAGTAERFRIDSNGNMGLGTTTPAVRFHAQQETAATNTVTNILRVDSQSSGTPATGIGVGIEMAAETASGNTEIGVILQAVTTDVTSTSEDFDLVVKNMTNGAAATEKLRVGSDGSVTVKNGNLNLATAGNGIQIKTGTNATAGIVTGLSGVTSTTVNTTQALTDSLIFVQPINTTDKHGFSVSSINNGSSFTVDFSGTYTGDLAWFIINQYPF